MKLHFAVGVLAVLGSAGLAHAADLTAPIVDDPSVVVDPSVDWTGVYAGVSAGYGWGNVKSVLGPIDPKGVFAGVDLGYNQQIGQFVLGAEADIQWSGLAGSLTTAGGAVIKGNLDYFGTVRGRAGVALGQLLPYVTAGVAYGHSSGSTTTAPGYTTANPMIGWTAGIGADYAVSDKVSLRAEYLYSDFGNVTYYSGTPVAETIHTSLGAARFGINFKF